MLLYVSLFFMKTIGKVKQLYTLVALFKKKYLNNRLYI